MPLQLTHIQDRKKLVWNGSFFVTHSLALVNRELSLALLNDDGFNEQFDLTISEFETSTGQLESDPRFTPLKSRILSSSALPDLTIRHRWPPDWGRPANGRLVVIQPWEFGSIPLAWKEEIQAGGVDEIWAYSNFVRDTYLQSGISAEKVKLVPLGVNTERFYPGRPGLDVRNDSRFHSIPPNTFLFLYVGGTIARKGIDALLESWQRAFTSKDPVALIIKDFGTKSFYFNQGAGALIEAARNNPNSAPILYLDEEMSEEEIASLYASCDCLVHPYRGEGYGLPIAEAMACGKPAIVTGFGAALDFANRENAYLIPASIQYMSEARIGDMPTVASPFWAEPDKEALADTLRRVFEHPEEGAAKGLRAAADIDLSHTWKHAASIALERIKSLTVSTQEHEPQSYILPMGLGEWKIDGISLAKSNTFVSQVVGFNERKLQALEMARKGDWDASRTSLEVCLLEAPEDVDVINALAAACFRTRDSVRALGLLQTGLKINPDSRDMRHNLAFILLKLDRSEEALPHALEAYRLTPDELDVRQALERVRQNLLKKARSILHSVPSAQRVTIRNSKEYKELMSAFREADSTLKNRANTNRISLCMIVKNEERFLENCLKSVQGLVDEIVIVDTGSTDSTVSIAHRYGAKVVDHIWKEDFSDARNISLKHATGDWVLWLDADEEIAPGAADRFRAAVLSAPPVVGAYMVKIRNWLTRPERFEQGEMAVHHACRLFRLTSGVYFEGRIHEQNLRSLRQLGFEQAWFDGLMLDHYGYAGEVMSSRNKHERFIRMLKREVEECPDEVYKPFHLFNLGNAYFTYGDMENTVECMAKAAEDADPTEEYTVTLYAEWATALQRLKRSEEGLEVCAKADALGLQYAGIEFARGHCFLALLRYEEAEKAFVKAIQFGKAKGSSFSDTGDQGVSSYKAKYGEALALMGQDLYAECVSASEEALVLQPGLTDARLLKVDALKRLSRYVEAKYELETILKNQPDNDLAERNLALLNSRLNESEKAIPILEKYLSIAPEDVEIITSLAACYDSLERYHDARDMYYRLLRLTPGSAEIYVNLGRALTGSGQDAEAMEAYFEAIKAAPGYSNSYFNAGDLLYKLGFYDRAADTYVAGLQAEPTHYAGFFVLGNCYFQLNQFEAAALSYRQELTSHPDHYEAVANLRLAEEMMQTAAA